MNIHTATYGESLFDIARRYSVMPTKILEDNDLACDTLADGEELLILKPTRTVTVAGGDTISSICRRFGVRRDMLIRNNPSLALSEALRPGRVLGVKYDAPPLGVATALGFIEKETSQEKFKRALPYLTYIVFKSFDIDKGNIRRLFNDDGHLTYAKNKITLAGIRDPGGFPLDFSLIDKIIDCTRGRYGGIYMSFAKERASERGALSSFLMEARRRLIGCDMLLFAGLYDTEDTELAEICDGAVLCSENERTWESFANDAESGRIFVSLDSLAVEGDRRFEIKDAIRLSRRAGAKIKTNEDTLISSFEIKRYVNGAMVNSTVSFPSLRRTKRCFEKLASLGYIGFAFDIQATPLSHLRLFNFCFARADYLL